MDVETRMKTIHILKKIEKNPEYSRKLGIYDTSFFIPYEKRKQKGEFRLCGH